MGRFAKDNDLLFTTAGDLRVDTDRTDLANTKNLKLRSLIQRMNNQIMSSPGDWVLEPSVGSGISQFLGKRNNPETGEQIKEAITRALTGPDLLRASELRVEVFPMSERAIAILVVVTPTGHDQRIVLTFTYDVRDNKLVPRNY